MTSALQILDHREGEKTRIISVTLPERIIEISDANVQELQKKFPRVSRSSYMAAALEHYSEALNTEAG